MCIIWIGRLRLHANIVRFQRAQRPTHDQPTKTYAETTKTSFASVLKKDNPKDGSSIPPHISSKPALVLDDSCLLERDFSMELMGKVKDVTAIPNLHFILSKEGFPNVKITYLGGLWVLFHLDSLELKDKISNHTRVRLWFTSINQACNTFVSDEHIIWVSIDGLPIKALTTNTFKKIALIWGVLVEWEDSVDDSLACKRICLRTKVNDTINERVKVIIRGKVHWIRAKELDTWEPDFDEENADSSSEDEFVAEEEKNSSGKQHNIQVDVVKNKEENVSESSYMHVDDLVYDSISKNQSGERSDDPFNIYYMLKEEKVSESSYMHGDDLVYDSISKNQSEERSEDPFNIYYMLKVKKEKDNEPKEDNLPFPPGFSPMNDGQHSATNAIKEHALEKTPHKNTNEMRWRNYNFRHFNEVRSESERFGTLFNPQGANAFNSFISSTGLTDLPLGGYSFTWAHKSATKMSKLDRFLISEGLMITFPHLSALCLDKHLSDHRPIWMRDMIPDYGPAPFRVFHSWFKMEGFEKIVKETWTGDENSRYFHGILNSKRSQLAIRGILNNSDWINDPSMVKKNFMEHFSNRFSKPDSSRLKLNFIFSKSTYCIGVNKKEVDKAARLVGCSMFSTPFNYLGVKVGDVMSKVKSWDENNKGRDLTMFISRKVGNREDTKLWEDIWLNDVALKVKFQRIYALELDKNVSVADQKKAFDLSFCRTPRGGVEEEQFKALHSCIIDLLLSQTRDHWVWSLNSSSEFLVKSV
nr:hypothetical protein [Tanacetum cinerariifolium]